MFDVVLVLSCYTHALNLRVVPVMFLSIGECMPMYSLLSGMKRFGLILIVCTVLLSINFR